jgi:tRNA-specific 2-thiouridylase
VSSAAQIDLGRINLGPISLGLGDPKTAGKIVVAMSGGVDSAVTAALAMEAGYDVVGVTLQLYDQGAAARRAGSCCAGQDIRDARAVADRLGFPHYVLDYESRFKESVIDAFADSYVQGYTPIPCVTCNQTVKFTDLLGVARDLGATALATGHYARRVEGERGAELHRAVDESRDQSYFLFATTRDQLDYLRFPLGDMAKTTVRAHAERLALPVAQKPDSQDICFVPNGRYADIVQKLRPEAANPGPIVDMAGRELGRHDGVIHFTIGQRKGIGVAAAEPLYVVALDPASATVTVGPRSALGRDQVDVRALNWLGEGDGPSDGVEALIKLRSAQPAIPGRLSAVRSGSVTARLNVPQEGVAPGQAAVFYRGAQVLGGGWITKAALSA